MLKGNKVNNTAVNRSLSNERKGAPGGFNSNATTQWAINQQASSKNGQLGSLDTNASGARKGGASVSRSNAPGMSYRSTGRGGHHNGSNSLGLTSSSPTGASLNGHPIFLNAELKQVLTTTSATAN